jgi:pimeloyl-ACP methyl ester carboxylesterase
MSKILEDFMANFVLLHGAWHWGGCYQKLATELLVAGHNVAMPDLATHGYDTTPAGTVADMAQYTAPARRLIEASSEPVILLGHSMGGASVTYLGEAMAEKISTLVYLTAFMVPNGKTPNDYIMSEAALANPRTAELMQLLAPTPTGLALDLGKADLMKAAFYADCSDHDVAISKANCIPVQSFVPVVTPSATTAGRFGRLRRVYIECTEDKAIAIETQRQMQHDVPGAEIVTMAASHSPFFSQTAQLGRILAGRF